jgi:DNA invertase Pin-like site-specific DNA recombinase
MTIKQQHALAHYIEAHGLKLHALSSYPTFTLFDPKTDSTSVVHIADMLAEYETELRLKERTRKARQSWRQHPKSIDIELA